MLKMLTMAGLAALVTACATPPTGFSTGTGSTAQGEATAAELGFHGPVYRANKTDVPN